MKNVRSKAFISIDAAYADDGGGQILLGARSLADFINYKSLKQIILNVNSQSWLFYRQCLRVSLFSQGGSGVFIRKDGWHRILQDMYLPQTNKM